MHERLFRSRDDRMLFGVAGGMADWLDIDPAIVRIVWALLVFAAGTGVLLYIVAAIVIPEEPLDRADVAVPMAAAPGATAGAGGPGAPMAAGEPGGATAGGATAGGAPSSAVPSAAPTAGDAAPAGAPSMAPTNAWVAGAYPSRRATREARRAERRASRGQREGNGVLILGVILIALGGWLLARTYIPFFDDRIVGPVFLVVVGVLLLVGALNRPRQSPPS